MANTMVFDKKTIKNNAFLMTLLRGCVSSYILSTFFDLTFPITSEDLINQYGEEEIEIFYEDRRTVEEILGTTQVDEFENMNQLLTEVLTCVEEIVFEKSYDIESVQNYIKSKEPSYDGSFLVF